MVGRAWLGGIFSWDVERLLAGVVCFGTTAGTNTKASVCGDEHKDKVITLTRGANTFWCHPHGGSKLVAGACREMAKKGYNIIIAYSDTEAGEHGVIYRYCNFLFCGTTGATERFRTPDGRVRDARLVSGYTRDRTGGTLKYKRTRAEQKEIMLEAWALSFFRGTPKLRWVGFFGSKTMKRRLRCGVTMAGLALPQMPPHRKACSCGICLSFAERLTRRCDMSYFMNSLLIRAWKASRDPRDCRKTIDTLQRMGFDDEEFRRLHSDSMDGFYRYSKGVHRFRDDETNHRFND